MNKFENDNAKLFIRDGTKRNSSSKSLIIQHIEEHRQNFNKTKIEADDLDSNNLFNRNHLSFRSEKNVRLLKPEMPQVDLNELEWDKDKDFIPIAESDTLSNYDLNERMSEVIKEKFLEFEMSTSASNVSFPTCSKKSENSINYDDSDSDNEIESNNYYIENFKNHKNTNAMNHKAKSPQKFSNLSNATLNKYDTTPQSSLHISADSIANDDLYQIKFLEYQKSFNLEPSAEKENENDTLVSENHVFYKTMQKSTRFDSVSMHYSTMSKNSNNDLDKNKENMYFQENNFNEEYDDDYDDEFEFEYGPFNQFYHSMPNLTLFNSNFYLKSSMANDFSSPAKSIALYSKHLSLIDLKSFQWIYIKNESSLKLQPPNRRNLIKDLKLDLKIDNNNVISEPNQTPYVIKSFTIKEKLEIKSPSSKIFDSGSNVNFSRVGKLEVIRSYMSQFSNKIKKIFLNTFNIWNNSKSNESCIDFEEKNKLHQINYQIIGTYDIIEAENDLDTSSDVFYKKYHDKDYLDNNHNTETELSSCERKLNCRNERFNEVNKNYFIFTFNFVKLHIKFYAIIITIKIILFYMVILAILKIIFALLDKKNSILIIFFLLS